MRALQVDVDELVLTEPDLRFMGTRMMRELLEYKGVKARLGGGSLVKVDMLPLSLLSRANEGLRVSFQDRKHHRACEPFFHKFGCKFGGWSRDGVVGHSIRGIVRNSSADSTLDPRVHIHDVCRLQPRASARSAKPKYRTKHTPDCARPSPRYY